MKIRPKTGFTLIEIMVALLIFSAVMGGIYGALAMGNRSWLYFLDHVTVQREAREALYFMARELREARGILITKEENGAALRFRRPGIGTVTYSWSRQGSNAGKLIREDSSGKRILARSISGLVFQYPTNRLMMIDITAQKSPMVGRDIAFNLKGKVALRSKTEFPD